VRLADGVFFFTDAIRLIARRRPVAALLEWLDEGRWFRREEDYVTLLGNEFAIEQKRKIHRGILRNPGSFLSQKARPCNQLNSS